MQHTAKSTTCRSMWVRQLGGEWSFSTRSCNFSLTFQTRHIDLCCDRWRIWQSIVQRDSMFSQWYFRTRNRTVNNARKARKWRELEWFRLSGWKSKMLVAYFSAQGHTNCGRTYCGAYRCRCTALRLPDCMPSIQWQQLVPGLITICNQVCLICPMWKR